MAEVIAGALRVVASAIALLSSAEQSDRRLQDILSYIYPRSNEYARKRFSRWWERLALRLMFIDMDLLMQVSDIVNTWDDIELLKWIGNLLGSFNAISVAGSVLASVNITALSMDGVSEIHWTTRAAFSISLLTSVLSVVFSMRTQRKLYLSGPKKLRSWLRDHHPQDAQNQFRSSIAATRLIQLPSELFAVSWVTFLAGLILYMSFMWRVHSDPGGLDYRNILICILLVLLILAGYYESIALIKDVEQRPTHTKTTPSGKENSASNANIIAQDGEYGNALQAACEGGYEQIVDLLLDKGAEVNALGGRYYGSALQAASARGHEQIVDLLLNKGAEVNAQGGFYGNALQAACEGGYEQLVRLLIKKGAEVNAQGGRYGSALTAASARGRLDIIELLFKEGANVNAQRRQSDTTSTGIATSSEGQEETV